MKPTALNSKSKATSESTIQSHPWLEKHYQEKRQRTVNLVKVSVDQLLKEQQTVTIEAICRKSSELDPEGRGVKKSAILENPEAHAYYRQHSTSYRQAQTRKRKGKVVTPVAQPLRIKRERNVDRVRSRYLQMTKSELVERLLIVEQSYAESQQQMAQLQFEWLEIQQRQKQSPSR
jgi:hypothetical protein